jgi:hypothetical protein
MGNVTYPQMIKAFKTWYGQNKTRPSKSVEIDGQSAVRKSSFGEMLVTGLTQLGIQAALSGFEFIKGGTEGLNKFLDTLPKEIAEPARSLAKSAGDAVNGLKSGLGSLIPEGGALGTFKSLLDSGLQNVGDNFINPIAGTLVTVRNAFTGDVVKLGQLQTLYQGELGTVFGDGVFKLGQAISGAIDTAKNWSDELTLGTGEFTLTDAFDLVNNSSNQFMSKFLGIGDVPTLSSIAGTLVKTDLIDNLIGAKDREQEAQLNLRKAAAIAFPTLFDEFGDPYTNPEIAELKIGELSLAEQAELVSKIEQYKIEFQSAIEEVESASTAIRQQIQTDQQNILIATAAQQAVDSLGSLANTYVSITDAEQRALFERTLKPAALETTKLIAPLIEKASSPVDPVID